MDAKTSDLDIILSELARVAGLPMEQATTIPAQAYTSEAFLALELEEIFAKEWVCVGRLEEVAEPGDYLVTQLAGESLLIVRGDDKRVRVLSNVCRHRWTQVANGKGNATRFVCPYHAWTYDREGRLVHTRYMEQSGAFRPQLPVTGNKQRSMARISVCQSRWQSAAPEASACFPGGHHS